MSAPQNPRIHKAPISRELRLLREELWGPLSPEERIAWSNALLDNPPTNLSVMGQFANTQLLNRDGIVLNRQWVAVARYWDDLGISPEQWLLQQGHFVEPSLGEDPWGDCTEGERRAWTAATLKFPPQFLGATVMGLHDKNARETGITKSKPWIDLAVEFRAAGFTPEEFIELNIQVRKFHRRGQANSLITTTQDTRNVQLIRLDAQEWVKWLQLYRAGEDSYVLTEKILAPNWGS